MKRRTWNKRRARRAEARARVLQRSNDRHDRWFVLAFMRLAVEQLARTDMGVDQKVFVVARIARQLAPSIMSTRALETGGEAGR
jgi:hypothetical protein